MSVPLFYLIWTVCLLDLLDCGVISAILLIYIYFDVSLPCYRVNVGDCACGNLKDSERERREREGEHNKTGESRVWRVGLPRRVQINHRMNF